MYLIDVCFARMAFSGQSHIVLQEWLSQSNLTLFCENGFLRAISHCFARMVFSEQSHIVLREWLSQSNLTLFWENGFRRAILHWRRSVGYNLRWKINFEQILSTIVYWSRIWWDYNSDVIIASHCKTAIICSYHDSCLIIDIIIWKDRRQNVQSIDKYKYL